MLYTKSPEGWSGALLGISKSGLTIEKERTVVKVDILRLIV